MCIGHWSCALLCIIGWCGASTVMYCIIYETHARSPTMLNILGNVEPNNVCCCVVQVWLQGELAEED